MNKSSLLTNPARSWLLFLVLLIGYAYFFPRWADWNQNSRLDMALSVVDKGTLAIDAYFQNTGDYALYGGHYYSDKAPGTAFLGIPIYWAFRNFVSPVISQGVLPRIAASPSFAGTLNPEGTGLNADKIYVFVALTFISFFATAFPSALLGILFYRLLGNFCNNELHKIGLTLGYCFATPAFAYSNLFLSHQIAAFCLFASFYLAFGWRRHKDLVRLIVIGFLLAYSIITEYPTGLIVAGIGLYTLYQVRDWRQWGWIVLGGIPPLLLTGLYNWAIFGTPLMIGYEYSALWQDVHQVGFLSLTFPGVEALWGITGSSYRGLFFISPFLLLALPGFCIFWRRKEFRPEFLVCAWAVTSFFLFNGSSAMWSGGFAVGPRYLVPMIPFLTLPIIFLLDDRRRWIGALTGILVLISFTLVWVETIGGQAFPQYEQNPLIDYSLPHFLAGDIARNVGMMAGLHGWFSLLPLFLLIGIAFAILLKESKSESWAGNVQSSELGL